MTANSDWEDFAKHTLPPDVSDVQRTEMRRAFFAGQLSAMMFLRSDDVCSKSDEDGAALMEARWQELKDFFRNFRKRN